MAIHGKLKVVLELDGNVIGESVHPGLCAAVLRLLGEEGGNSFPSLLEDIAPITGPTGSKKLKSSEAVSRLAEELGVAEGHVMGALDPIEQPPYIRINKRYWEGLVRELPKRGRGAIAPFSLVLTILGVWKDCARLGNATIDEGMTVLESLGLHDKHRNRAIENCVWLMKRGQEVALNPGMMTTALEIVRALCEKRKPEMK